jgi:predicted ATP-binding protein involved in virulence
LLAGIFADSGHTAVGTPSQKRENGEKVKIVGFAPLKTSPGKELIIRFSAPIVPPKGSKDTPQHIDELEHTFLVRVGDAKADIVDGADDTLKVFIPPVGHEYTFDKDLPLVVFAKNIRMQAEEALVLVPAPKTTYEIPEERKFPDPPMGKVESFPGGWYGYGLIAGSIGLACLAGVFAIISRKRQRDESNAYEMQFVPIPQVPEELWKRCAEGNCVLVAGTGLSAQAGYPSWAQFAKALLDSAVNSQVLPKSSEPSLRALLKQKQLDLVVDAVVNGREGGNFTLEVARATYGALPPAIPELHRVLSKINFSGVMQTALDNLVDRSFAENRDAMNLTFTDSDKLIGKLSARQFFLHRPFGRLDQPSSIFWTLPKWRDAIATDKKYAHFLTTLTISKTLFFIGLSFDGVKAFMESVPGPDKVSGSRHFALISVDDPSWKERANELERRFNVSVLPFSRGKDYREVSTFVDKLLQETEVWRGQIEKIEGTSDNQGNLGAEEPSSRSVITSVTLRNIGPFDEIELSLDRSWTVLLGENGVGKSTILKAIAVGLCGEDAKDFAGELIKVRRQSPNQAQSTETGTIILKTSHNHNGYVTNIRRTGTRVEVESLSGRLSDAEDRLVVGFPALRTMSRLRAERRDIRGTLGQSTPDDLLPLITGGPDPRLDKLKGWILSLDHAANQIDTSDVDRKNYKRVLDTFFRVIEELTPGLTIKKGEVNAITGQISLKTDDGEVPLEAVSQGTTSLLGLAGILLQRLNEFYGQEVNKSALVLIDEIDAHMHPLWQKLITTKLHDIFPAVQFIATTHSPLIVSSLKKDNVRIFARDSGTGNVQVGEPHKEFEGLRSDQILTSELFRMQTTRSLDTVEKIRNLSELLAKNDRAPDEDEKVSTLTRELDEKLWRGETTREREIEKAVQTVLLERWETKPEESYAALKTIPVDVALEIRRQLGKLLDEPERQTK